MKLARMLIDASTNKRFDISKYKDEYAERLGQVIKAKVKGKEIVAPPEADEKVSVVNLMDALKRSLDKGPSKTGPRTSKRQSTRRRERA